MALTKRGKYWHIHFTRPDGQRVRQSARTADRRQAEELEAQLKAGAWREVQLKESQATWPQAVVSWLQSTTHKDRSGVEEKLRWLHPHLAGRSLREIDRRVLYALRDAKLAEGVRPATVNRHLAVVSAVLNHAHKRGWLDSVPPIPKMKEPKGKERWLTLDEAETLLAALRAMPRSGHVADMVEFGLFTGLREANICGLEWERVTDTHCWIPETKSGKALRVPLASRAREVLDRWRGRDERWVFVYRGKRLYKVGKTILPKVCADLGWHDVSFHTMRHSWASWHAQAGTPLAMIQKLGGWSSYQMVQRYAHLAPDTADQFAENIVTKSAQG